MSARVLCELPRTAPIAAIEGEIWPIFDALDMVGVHRASLLGAAPASHSTLDVLASIAGAFLDELRPFFVLGGLVVGLSLLRQRLGLARVERRDASAECGDAISSHD